LPSVKGKGPGCSSFIQGRADSQIPVAKFSAIVYTNALAVIIKGLPVFALFPEPADAKSTLKKD